MRKFCSLTIVFIMLNVVCLLSQIQLLTWGQNINGQLGDGTINQKNFPEQITNNEEWTVISSGYQHSFGIKSDGSLWAWGDNSAGQLGIQVASYKVNPIRVDYNNDWKMVSCGYGHTLALKSDGSLWACGYNAFGQLGIGNNQSTSYFTQVGYENNWKVISSGGYHSLAIKEEGTLWAWGDNQYGQLGRGNDINSRNPVQIGTANDWVMVSAGESYSHAIKSDGTLWACGHNGAGQLGDGTNTYRNVFVQVGTDNDWDYVYCGGGFTTAIKENHTLWTWGGNNLGQLGDDTYNERNYPQQIGSDTDWLMTKCGESHTLALKNNGTLWSWGGNTDGQLGDGTVVERNYPVQIGLSNNWSDIACGGFFSMALNDLNDFTVPILVSPNNNKEKLPTSVLFQWRPFPNTIHYNLQVAKDINFDNIIIDNSDILDTFAIVNLVINTKYYWRVRAASYSSVSEWSQIWTFKTIIKQIKTPNLIYPSDNSLDLPVIIDFLWEQQDDVQLYNIQISKDIGFNTLLIDSTLNSNHISKLFSYNTFYYWRVRAINYDYYTDWSDFYTFKTKMNSGVEDDLLETNIFTIFPNPAKDYLNIICNFTNDNPINLRINDLLGNQLFNKKISIKNNEISLPIDFLHSGIYIIMLNIDNRKYTKQLIINK